MSTLFYQEDRQSDDGPLSKSRLQSTLRASEKVSIDYGGPFLSYSVDTDSFINAFTWMTSRRGTLTYVISDHGTNFVGTERELWELVEAFDTDKVMQEASKYHPIDWKFNPLSAPHFGGVF